ncbi:TlpA family protein disulfide reductase [Sulfurospirillum arcachonense]|uniref:TlpA family protein disulfide reductase n=1 Tax=Sulfurospirillum arcachonense TaxID=57666 RepID=UPI000468E4F9|nr:TlpA disulfide reductase family protein [Sulfurospirillum arcachonense]
MKTLFTIILSLFIFTGCNNETDKKENTTSTSKIANKNKQDITLVDINGKTIKVKKTDNGFIFDGYENKIILLNFFTTWCPPCKAEIPHLNNLQQKYKKELSIISILLEENKSNDEIIKFMNSFNIEFTITNSPDNYKLAEAVGGVKSIPLILIYDKKGDYFQHYIGAIPEEMIEADIKKVLK